MNILLRIMILYVPVLGIVGCNANGIMMPATSSKEAREQYLAIHRSGAKTIPYAVELEELYGDADHFITHFGFGRMPLQWNTEVFFGDRYILTMQVDVEVDYAKRRVVPVGKPVFYLTEVDTVSHTEFGNVVESYSNSYTFGLEEWEKVFASKGDFSTIGISINSTPVAGFHEVVRAARRPRIPVSLVFKKVKPRQEWRTRKDQ